MMGQRLVKSTRCRQADPPLQRRSTFIIMQAEEQQAFKINVQAKAKNFVFKFKSTQIVPAWKFHRISISLKLRKFFLRVNSEFTVHQKTKKNPESIALVPRRQHHPQQQKQPLKSKFLRIFKKLCIRRAKTPGCPEAESTVNRLKQFAYEEIISAGTLVTGVLAFLLESITSRPRKGVTLFSLVALLLLMVGLNNYLKYCGENVLDYIGMAWNFASDGWPKFLI